MGHHDKECARAYRKRRKQAKRRAHKTSILTTGNLCCNTEFAFTNSDCDSSICISGIETLPSTLNGGTLPENNINIDSPETSGDINETKETVSTTCAEPECSRDRDKTAKEISKLKTTGTPSSPLHTRVGRRLHVEILNDPLYLKFKDYQIHKRRIRHLKNSKI